MKGWRWLVNCQMENSIRAKEADHKRFYRHVRVTKFEFFNAIGPGRGAISLTLIDPQFAWLVNRIFGVGTIQAIFGPDHFIYCRCVGLFAMWSAARGKVKHSGLR
jgi:hypothetical protein